MEVFLNKQKITAITSYSGLSQCSSQCFLYVSPSGFVMGYKATALASREDIQL